MKTQFLTTSISVLALSVAFSAASAAQTLDYTAMSDLFGEPVTAGATGAPQRASDVPATMVIITQDDIERFPEYDIPGVLRHFAGVNFNRYAFGDGQVSIRGAATPYTPRLLVLVNGREVYLDSYGYTAWSSLPVEMADIQQIEVVKGPQSALYGFNAVAGVVNIITRNPAHGDYMTARADVGTDEYSNISLSGGRQFTENFSARFSYGTQEGNEFAPYAPNAQAVGIAAAGNQFSRENASVAATFRFNDKVSMNAEVTTSDATVAETGSIYLAGGTEYDLNSYQAGLEADTDFGFLTFFASRNESEIVYNFGSMENSITVFRVQDLINLTPNDTIRFSVEYRDAEAGSFPDATDGDFGYTSSAFAAMWSHKFSNELGMTLALRYDSVEWSRDASPNPAGYPFVQADYDRSIEELSYNAAMVWRPEAGGTVRFSAARGVQAPTMFDMGFTLFFGTASVSGDPSIEPSVVTNYEIAYDRNLTPDITLRAAIFHQETTDVKGGTGVIPTVFPPASPVPVYLFGNHGDTQVSGAEFALAGDMGQSWNWDVNYTYQSVEDDLLTFGVFTPQDFEGVTPTHLMNAHLGWTGGRFTVDGFVNYVSSVDMPMQPAFGFVTSEAIGSQVALSLRGQYDLTDWLSVALNAQNVNFGDGEVTNTNHLNESRVWASLTSNF
ncbi:MULTISPECIES: TonB-dependent siderophore receptor [Maricaulis]|jgi:outer membrane receptor for ferrienterochelin and colicins|uniref:TonB-dependent receptor plug domain-containing protein n=1 Tax=Maricaulis TaxID=74317 RepID=UPI000C5A1160|nr:MULTISPECIES: TonB-dependent receptor [Maricaulis]MAC87709.1 TonB-dependent receptor [Maricaulis sp.]